ncbi:MAG: chitobiase/beta-hexosaminidase C-terminal domain-containing protein [Verrucomicrobiales bacterium]|nr:chitobiase/beta-hexosaminidase C-terminal domain-containing protein [Verrucomicrobiales bacterium]
MPRFFLFPSLTALWLTVFPCLGTPRIAEFQANNVDTISDDDGQTSDWVEIFNPDPAPFDLTGCSLTDDPLQPQKWIFPAVTLPPGGSLLVWASGKDRTNPATPLHLSFKLEQAGGYLALVAADGSTKLTEFAPYPAQPPDRSYGTTSPQSSEVPVAPGAACRLRVPSGTITGWESRTFNDSAWTAAATGVGFDRSTASVNFLPLLGAGGNVEAAMYSIRGTCYVRIPFTLTNASAVQSLTLSMKYDDGFAAFLNGVRLNPPAAAATNAPASLAFNSQATAVRPDADAVTFAAFDISGQRSVLVDGTNVLAIQALNQSITSSDVLMVPKLELTKLLPGSGTPGYFARPTPGAVNTAATVSGFVDAPDFDVKRGFFTAPTAVTLTTHTAGAEIRYTTNGSAPTAATGTPYTAPVIISTTTVLRAAAFLPGWQPSVAKTHTYIFAVAVKNQPSAPPGFPSTWGWQFNFSTGQLQPGFPVPADYRMDPGVTGNPAYSSLIVPALSSTLPVMSLSTATTSLFNPNGIYANDRLGSTEIPVSVEYFSPTNPATDKFQEDAGLRIHGGDAPLEHPKKPFRIYFRKDYGVGRLNYPLYPGSPVSSFNVLQLRPGGHDGWSVPFGSGPESLARHATYCRDRFMRQTEMDMGRLSPRGKYLHLYINGLYWGVYDLHEVPNNDFFSDHAGGGQNDWDVVEQTGLDSPLYDIVDGDGAAMDALLALCRPPSNLQSDAVYEQAGALIDIDAFIDHLLVQMWGGQNDWMGPVYRGVGNTAVNASRFFNKNWDAGRRSRGGENVGFLWNVWDAEISMGSSLTNLVNTQRVADFDHTRVGTPTSISGIVGTPGPPAEIYYALRQNARFCLRFADRIQRHFFNQGALTAANNLARLEALQNELMLPIVAESARWGDVNSGDPDIVTFTRDEHWLSELNWLKNTYIATRNQTLLAQFQHLHLWSGLSAPVFSQSGGLIPPGFALGMTNPNAAPGIIYYTLDGTDPINIQLVSANLAGPGSPCVYKVPEAQYPGNSWKSLADPEDLATWTPGSAALGYGNNAAFTPHISTNVTGMQGVRSSVYVRIPFALSPDQVATMSRLSLRLKCADGAIVFLNGSTPVARLNAPNTSPAFDDTATANRSTAAATADQVIDLSHQIPTLVAGANVLAIQGLVASTSDPEFLLVPTLTATFGQRILSSSALAYTGPVPLDGNTPVNARLFTGEIWSPLATAAFSMGVPASAGKMVISEFSYNPAVTPEEEAAGLTSPQLEFIELLNISQDILVVPGLEFTRGIQFVFDGRTARLLPPGGRLVIAADPAALRTRFPDISIAGAFANGSHLSNGGERLTLAGAGGATVFDFSYLDEDPWPSAPDGEGFSLVLINPFANPDPADPANWRISVPRHGSPGRDDATNFAAWASVAGAANNPFADDNHNGLNNLTEYALAVPPGSASPTGILSAGFETSGTDTWLVVRYATRRGADDVVVIPEMSSDLAVWQPMTEAAAPPVLNSDGTTVFAMRSPAPVAADQRRYVRISIRLR